MAEFTFTPSIGFSSENSQRVSVASFGDGYSQRVSEGINNLTQVWNLSFQNNTIQNILDIEAFLKSKLGSIPFTWLPPGDDTEVYVVCSRWTKTYDSSIGRSLNTTFERVYGYT